LKKKADFYKESEQKMWEKMGFGDVVCDVVCDFWCFLQRCQ